MGKKTRVGGACFRMANGHSASPPMVASPSQSQQPSHSFADEVRQLLRLGLPIAFVQFGMTAMNFIDVAMLGRHNEVALPAMALGNLLSWAASVFCMGAVTAMDPLLSQAVGADDREAIPRLLGRGALLALVLTIPTGLMLMPAATWLSLFGQPEALIPEAANYARLQALGILPFLWYSVLRSVLSSHASLMPQVLTIVLGNLANAGLDWLLIFGNWGMPELGATGAAITTVSCRWLMLLGLCWFGWRDLGPHLMQLRNHAIRARAFALGPLWRLLKLGLPIGTQFALEMGAFALTGLLIGHYDAVASGLEVEGGNLAAHQIALQLATMSFMVPLGLGMAASVRVGWAVGRGDPKAIRRSVSVALVSGATIMSGFMLLFILLPSQLASLLVIHEGVQNVAAALIPIAGVFQIGDGLQVVAVGCLRGMGDMRSAVVANIVGFWVLGLPIGAWLAFGCDLGPAGFWWGLVIGLSAVAVGLLWVVFKRAAEKRGRLSVD
jgi:MATE family multidrug resistance protein